MLRRDVLLGGAAACAAIAAPAIVRFVGGTVADASPIPLLLYNAPGFNGVTLSFALLSRLRDHPNVVGMKDSSPNDIAKNIELDRTDFRVMPGSITTLFPSMLQGAVGGTVSPADWLPDRAVEIWDCGRRGDRDRGQALHERLVRLNRRVSGTYGVAGAKAAMDLLGYRGGAPRLPLQALTADQMADLRRFFEEEDVL